ncbi:unnamed protein product [Linum tenue]|uniref:Uncharacterized protein n=1 Tax=Linum tenue TaxID=586396 RepID=A0AAV0JXT8_9ROSI|nr:unnamed protein product [Linum tenue]
MLQNYVRAPLLYDIQLLSHISLSDVVERGF